MDTPLTHTTLGTTLDTTLTTLDTLAITQAIPPSPSPIPLQATIILTLVVGLTWRGRATLRPRKEGMANITGGTRILTITITRNPHMGPIFRILTTSQATSTTPTLTTIHTTRLLLSS